MFQLDVIMKVIIHKTMPEKPKKTIILMKISRLLRHLHMHPFVRTM